MSIKGIFSFLYSTSYGFEGKKEGEEVIIFLHRHWFTIASKIFAITVGFFIPFIVLGIFGKAISSLHLLPFFAALWALYYLILWYSLFYSLTMYTLDSWIVTNMRIINSIQHGFFNRSVSELAIDKIQDVSLDVDGALATMVNFGNIKVQSAGSEKHFTFQQIPRPQEVKDTIMHLVSTRKHEVEKELGKELKEEIFGVSL